MTVDATLAVKHQADWMAPRRTSYAVKAVNVLKAHGKSARESIFSKGFALDRTVASRGNRSNHRNRCV